MINKAVSFFLIFTVAACLGIGMRLGGSSLNRFVDEQNGGQMPVWVINSNIDLLVAMSPQYRPLTKESRYKFLCDIIPQPIVDVDDPGIHLDMMSIGDITSFAGEFLIFADFIVLILFPPIFVVQKIR